MSSFSGSSKSSTPSVLRRVYFGSTDEPPSCCPLDFFVLGQIENFADKTLKKDKFEELSSWILKELKSPVSLPPRLLRRVLANVLPS